MVNKLNERSNLTKIIDTSLEELNLKHYRYLDDLEGFIFKLEMPNNKMLDVIIIGEEKLGSVRMVVPEVWVIKSKMREIKKYVYNFNNMKILYGTLSIYNSKKKRLVSYSTAIPMTKSKTKNILKEELRELLNYVGYINHVLSKDLKEIEENEG
ncbi:hypothetical protein MOC46_08265 [Bacillus spizizenii]|nr:hypothetical protein [Bacillus spizizenii]MCY9242983.1 hypothetical protein [Bacillus spizizenii]